MVLVADPDWDYRELLSIALEREGFRVTTARNAKRVVVELAQVDPALILLDTSFTDTFAASHQTDARPRTPLILVGATSRTRIPGGLADGSVPKPFRLRDLLRLARRLTSYEGPGEGSGDREPRKPLAPDPGALRATAD